MESPGDAAAAGAYVEYLVRSNVRALFLAFKIAEYEVDKFFCFGSWNEGGGGDFEIQPSP